MRNCRKQACPCRILLIFLFILKCGLNCCIAEEASKTGDSPAQVCKPNTPFVLLENDVTTKDFPVEVPAAINRAEVYSSGNTQSDQLAASTLIKKGPEGGPIVIRLQRPDSITTDLWSNSYLFGSAFTKDKKSISTQKVQMTVREKTSQSITVDALLPINTDNYENERWTIVPVICSTKDNKVIGFATASVLSISIYMTWIISLICIAAFWASITFASFQLNKARLDELWAAKSVNASATGKWEKLIWQLSESANPIFMSQDALGVGSLARFQILIFTTVVGFVLIFIYVHSGFISNLSTTVLILLGVNVIGGTFARTLGDWQGISSLSQRWLIGSHILNTRQDKPRWSDLFETQGELDVAKIQALLFTLIISLSILASSYSGLSSFALPDQVVYLAMLSQGAYVFGKLLPADTRKRVEDVLEMLRKSAKELVAKPDDQQAQTSFSQAKEAARQTLDQTYMERFDGAAFDKSVADPKNVF